MAKRKRTTRRTGIVDRAVSAGRQALREAEKRVPPDLRRRAERRIKDADKTARAAIKALQTQVNRASTRADVNSVLRRIDGLTKQARQVIQGTGPRRTATAARGRAKSTTRRAAAAKPKRKAPATRKAAATRKAPAARKASATRTATRTATRRSSRPRRRRAAAEEPTIVAAPMAGMGEVEIIEVIPEP